jgi:predicted acetyltransferase
MRVRAIRAGEAERFVEHVLGAFETEPAPEQLEALVRVLEPERCVVAEDGASWVASAGASTRELSLPGGRTAPCAAIAFVTTRPTHRRRGLLRATLGALHEAAAEPLGALWPSEGAIYGRFGYGPASWHARLRLDPTRAALRADAPAPQEVRLADRPPDVLGELCATHDAARRTTPGMLDRPAEVWRRHLLDLPADREGLGPLRAALTDGGYALYAVRTAVDRRGAASELEVRELVAPGAAARTALWRFLSSIDLVRAIRWDAAPVDEPLVHLLADPRAVQLDPADGMWVAPLDLRRALAARTYAAPVDVVLDVDGEVVRLRAGADGDAVCVPAGGPAEVRLGREALGAALLGGPSLTALAAAGRAGGDLRALARALRGDREPADDLERVLGGAGAAAALDGRRAAGAAEQDVDVRVDRVDRRDGLPDELGRRHRGAQPDDLRGEARHGGRERVDRDVGAEELRVEARALQRAGDHVEPDDVLLALQRREQDGPAAGLRRPDEGAERPHRPVGDRRGEVLVGDRHLAHRPEHADLAERRGDDLVLDLRHLHPVAQRPVHRALGGPRVPGAQRREVRLRAGGRVLGGGHRATVPPAGPAGTGLATLAAVPRALAPLLLALLVLLAGCADKGATGDDGRGPAIGVKGDEEEAAADLGFPAFATKNTTRVAAEDAVALAAGVARAVFPGLTDGSRPKAVALAPQDDWRAAVAASVLMAEPIRAPLLLAGAEDLPQATEDALEALRPSGSREAGDAQVVRVGDVATPGGLRTTDVRGADPFALARAVDAFVSAARGGPSEQVLVVSADDPAFAMPAAAWAAKSGDPVLFVQRDRVPPETIAALRTHRQPRIYVLGPSKVVTPSVTRQLRRLGTVKRVGGATPESNAIAFTRYVDGTFGWGFTQPGHGVVVTASRDPLVAAAAAPLASSGTYAPPLLLQEDGTIGKQLEELLLVLKPGFRRDPALAVYNHGWVLGDDRAVPLATQARLDELLEVAEVSTEPPPGTTSTTPPATTPTTPQTTPTTPAAPLTTTPQSP